MKRNTELLNRVADAIEKNPYKYDQVYWARSLLSNEKAKSSGCDSAFCIAGWAVALEGYTKAHVTREDDYCRERVVAWDDVSKPRGRKIYEIEELAPELLGLGEEEAGHLFDGEWTPKGYRPSYWKTPWGRRKAKARLAAQALRRLATGASISDVTERT